ncbi:hypothetical protein [Levilactobacillus cerevisiae]|uniref:hypothetical protein n=1 Tax=Levilactobacillus cerevisiae TaxID=1704076 RepID=UPI000F775CE9|nr:hypothetical protein [Levilactobacillus cerevisiae]
MTQSNFTTTVNYQQLSAEERGSNESLNGLLREFIPKGISLENYDLTTIQAVQNARNHRLHKSLGYASAAQVFQDISYSVYASSAYVAFGLIGR